MDSNFKLNQLYLLNDLQIFKSKEESINLAHLENVRTKKTKVYHNHRAEAKELFFKIEDKYETNLRANHCAFQFLTDLFQLVFHRHSNLIQARGSYDATLLHHRNHFYCELKYENKFILKVSGKQVEHILISNFCKDVAEPILKKHNRLFECL